MGVFGFFVSVDLFTMFMFYEVALIPMYLLIGVWGSGRKEYAAMKLTLMLMGGSALLLIGILGIYFGAGATTMNILEIAQLHNICLLYTSSSASCCWPASSAESSSHANAKKSTTMIHMEYYLVLSTIMMFVGIYGFVTRRNLLAMLISVELILNSVDINFVVFNLSLIHISRACVSTRY